MSLSGQPTFVKEFIDDGLSEEEWVYIGEYVFILSMNESGEKIESIVEFLDRRLLCRDGRWLRGRRGI